MKKRQQEEHVEVSNVLRPKHATIRLSEQEQEDFKRVSRAKGKSLSEWLRGLGERAVEEFDEFAEE